MVRANAELRQDAPPRDREVTVEELLANPQWNPCELVNGKVISMSPAGHRHGEIGGNLFGMLWPFIRARKLGKLYLAETGFLYPDKKTVRAPDLMFLSRNREPEDLSEDGFLPCAPDLAVEVISPSDSFSDVVVKANSYLDVDVRLVWVIEPLARQVYVFRHAREVLRLGTQDQLSGEDVLPGFSVSVSGIFDS